MATFIFSTRSADFNKFSLILKGHPFVIFATNHQVDVIIKRTTASMRTGQQMTIRNFHGMTFTVRKEKGFLTVFNEPKREYILKSRIAFKTDSKANAEGLGTTQNVCRRGKWKVKDKTNREVTLESMDTLESALVSAGHVVIESEFAHESTKKRGFKPEDLEGDVVYQNPSTRTHITNILSSPGHWIQIIVEPLIEQDELFFFGQCETEITQPKEVVLDIVDLDDEE